MLEELNWELQARLDLYPKQDDSDPRATEVKRLRSFQAKIEHHLQSIGKRPQGSRHSSLDETFVATVKELLNGELWSTRQYCDANHKASLVQLFTVLFELLPSERRKHLVSPAAAAKLAVRVAPAMEWLDPKW